MHIFSRPVVRTTKRKLETEIKNHDKAIATLELQLENVIEQLRQHVEVRTALNDALMSLELSEGIDDHA